MTHAEQSQPALLPALVQAAADGAVEFGGNRIVALEVGDVLSVTDWFVITSAPNTRQVRRITEEVEASVKAAGGFSPLRVEGLDLAQWVLMDFGEFVVHVFTEQTRAHYDLERLWSDVPSVTVGQR